MGGGGHRRNDYPAREDWLFHGMVVYAPRALMNKRMWEAQDELLPRFSLIVRDGSCRLRVGEVGDDESSPCISRGKIILSFSRKFISSALEVDGLPSIL